MVFITSLLMFVINSFNLVSMILFVQFISVLVLIVLLFFNPGFSSCYTSLIFDIGPLNVLLVVLSLWIGMLMILSSLKHELFGLSSRVFVSMVLWLLLTVILFFLVDSFLLLYIFFELSLIPTVVLILKWGYQPERLQASFYFVMYTVCASLPLLLMIIGLGGLSFSFSMFVNMPMSGLSSMFVYQLNYIAMFLAFMVKVPMWGVHLWLRVLLVVLSYVL